MGFVVLPSSLPYPGGCGKWFGWLGGLGWEYGRGFVLAPLLGLPILLSPFPSLASWVFGLISSCTQTSGCQQDPLFPVSKWLLRGRWLTLGPI